MSVSRVNTTSGTGSGTSLAATAANHAAGNFLLVAVGWESDTPTISSITDTAGNSYTLLTKGSRSGADAVQIGYAYNIAGNASNVVTVNFSGSPGGSRVIVAQYSGVKTSADPFDVEATPGNGSGTAAASGSATPSAVDCLLVNVAVNFGGVTWSPTSPWVTEVLEVVTTALDERIVTPASGSYTAAQTASGTTDWVIAFAAFQAAPAVPIVPVSNFDYAIPNIAPSIWPGGE